MAQPTTLLLTDLPLLDVNLLLQVSQSLGTPVQDFVISTSSAGLAIESLSGRTFSNVVSLASKEGFHSSGGLHSFSALVSAGGRLLLQEPSGSQEGLCKALLLSGFVNARAAQALAGHPTQSAAQGQKPAWQTGAKSSISLRKPAPLNFNKKAAPVILEDDLIDEDDLLTEEDRLPPPAAVACAPGAAKKACANCSCGRAEAEAEGKAAEPVKLTQAMLDNPTTNCGSCSLGDAFRCASCPYRGLPRFEMGKKIQLPNDFLTVDA
ncbi:hypothetical protein WJX84_005752 [Apatococcus fuscideae]|uniref:Anamorsin homolog n=1 Tax=Apatococcus fuscideae TaxID=2026836 RepID=A0AAW1TFA4_9CHLO